MSSLVFGIHAVYETLRMRADDVIHLVLLRGRTHHNLDHILNAAKERQIPILYKDKNEFLKWIRSMRQDQANHQGIVAEVRRQAQASLEDILDQESNSDFLLILDEIHDPQNLGALIRSAACAGANAVIIPKRGAAQITAAVRKVAQGGTEHIPICRVTNINYTLKKIREAGFTIFGMAGDAEASLYNVKFSGPVALIIGNEENGLRRMVKENCDHLIKIPMPGGMESLNASVAGGIAMFEIVRRRKP